MKIRHIFYIAKLKTTKLNVQQLATVSYGLFNS